MAPRWMGLAAGRSCRRDERRQRRAVVPDVHARDVIRLRDHRRLQTHEVVSRYGQPDPKTLGRYQNESHDGRRHWNEQDAAMHLLRTLSEKLPKPDGGRLGHGERAGSTLADRRRDRCDQVVDVHGLDELLTATDKGHYRATSHDRPDPMEQTAVAEDQSGPDHKFPRAPQQALEFEFVAPVHGERIMPRRDTREEDESRRRVISDLLNKQPRSFHVSLVRIGCGIRGKCGVNHDVGTIERGSERSSEFPGRPSKGSSPSIRPP